MQPNFEFQPFGEIVVEMLEYRSATAGNQSRQASLITSLLLVTACAAPTAQVPPSLLEFHTFRGKDGVMILDTRIGDSEPLPFILDTGASPCVVDPVIADQLGINSSAAAERRGGAGMFKSGVTDLPVTLMIGSNQLLCTETLVTDLSGVTQLVGVRPAGIIGGDFFRGRVVQIDHDRASIAIHDRSTYRRPEDGGFVPIHLKKNRSFLYANLSVPGGPQNVARELLIDTGSLDHVADPLLKESKIPLKPITSTGLGSGFAGAAGIWNKVEIGSYTFDDVPGNVPSVPIVGNGILARFNLVFDYEGGWLLLRPREKRLTPKASD